MNIGLIGCGKVGTSLFCLLKKKNRIIGVYDIEKRNQQRAVKYLSLVKNASHEEICIRSRALFFATPDDKIATAFAKAKQFLEGEKYVFHFSGLLPSTIFSKSKNIHRASIHPFATFPEIILPPVREKYSLFIEGDKAALRAAGQIFKSSYFNMKKITKHNKAKYHLIGVFSSNLLVGLISAIEGLSRDIGWTKKDASAVISPVMKTTLANVMKNGVKNALSGPLARGDISTIKKHLKILQKNKNLSNIYKTLSLAILKNIVTTDNRKKIEKLLNKF
jgi:predicted short-subunit dehydrogenase-like oxidoreductase (DUF2520 family)